MSVPFAGELSALAAAFCWALAAVMFRRVGIYVSPLLLNLYKSLIASALLLAFVVWNWDLQVGWGPYTVVLLLASGAIGIGIGDTAFFAALNQLGERRTMLIAETLAPPFAAMLGLTFLLERLSIGAMLGIPVTLLGIAWVVSEKPMAPSTEDARMPRSYRGVLLAVLAAASQAGGAILSRHVLTASEVGPVASSLLRLLGGLLFLFAWIPVVGRINPPQPADQSRRLDRAADPIAGRFLWHRTRTWTTVLVATCIGTLMGIVFQQIALQHTQAAVAQTLIATSVLFVIPLGWLQGQPVSFRTCLGAAIALAGVALLLFGER